MSMMRFINAAGERVIFINPAFVTTVTGKIDNVSECRVYVAGDPGHYDIHGSADEVQDRISRAQEGLN